VNFKNRRDFRSCRRFEIIKKAGSWFSYGETKLGQGRDAVKSLIKDNPELADELEAKIKERIKKLADIKLKKELAMAFISILKTSISYRLLHSHTPLADYK
jgi:hypothetical protein